MIVAEQVAAALEGGLVTNAVNIPSIRPEDLDVLGPFMPVTAKLGRLAMELAEGHASRIELSYLGVLAQYDTRLLTVAALNGAFQGRTDIPVNYVNAPLVAAERGIEVAEERKRHVARLHEPGASARWLERQRRRGGRHDDGERPPLWLASALGFELDIELAPLMVFLRYDDVPGVIGRVGTRFGENGVNIANMAVSRTRKGGKALMALSIDTAPPPELVEQVRADVDDAWFVDLG